MRLGRSSSQAVAPTARALLRTTAGTEITTALSHMRAQKAVAFGGQRPVGRRNTNG